MDTGASSATHRIIRDNSTRGWCTQVSIKSDWQLPNLLVVSFLLHVLKLYHNELSLRLASVVFIDASSETCVLVSSEAMLQAVETGEAKANGPFAKTFISAILAGAYVGFGAMLALMIGGNCWDLAASNPGLQKMIFGAFGLPVGLLMVSFQTAFRGSIKR